MDFIYPDKTERELNSDTLIDITVSHFIKGVEHKLSYQRGFVQRVNYELLLADIAYQLGFKGAFYMMDPPYVKQELGGVDYFKAQTEKDFLVLYQDGQFEFCLCLEDCDLPVVGVEPKSVVKLVNNIRNAYYPIFDPDFEPILYKRHITRTQLAKMKGALESDLESYADDHYRYQWALDNLKVVEQLEEYVGQTVLISLNRDYDDGTLEIMGTDSFDDISEDEWFLDMCMYID
jgi:hypothetical protein